MTCRSRRCPAAVRHAAAASSNLVLAKRLAGQVIKAASADSKRTHDASSKMAVARAGTFHGHKMDEQANIHFDFDFDLNL